MGKIIGSQTLIYHVTFTSRHDKFHIITLPTWTEHEHLSRREFQVLINCPIPRLLLLYKYKLGSRLAARHSWIFPFTSLFFCFVFFKSSYSLALMATEKERETHVYMAKLSEQAERYDGTIPILISTSLPFLSATSFARLKTLHSSSASLTLFDSSGFRMLLICSFSDPMFWFGACYSSLSLIISPLWFWYAIVRLMLLPAQIWVFWCFWRSCFPLSSIFDFLPFSFVRDCVFVRWSDDIPNEWGFDDLLMRMHFWQLLF